MQTTKNFLTAIVISISSIVNAVTIKSPKYEYAFSAMKQVAIKKIDLSKDNTIVTFKLNDGAGGIRIGRDIYIIEDGGIAHPATAINGADFDATITSELGTQREFTVTFAPCTNLSTQCLDIINGNDRIYGIHDADVSINVPQHEPKIDVTETQRRSFTMDSVEIVGKIPGYKSTTPQNIYCQYRHVYKDIDKDKRHVALAADGTFRMKLAADHPELVLLIIYDRDKQVHEGLELASNIFVRPGSRLNLTIHSAVFDPANAWKGTEMHDDSGLTTYPELVNWYSTVSGTLYDLSVNNNITAAGRMKLSEAYQESIALAHYIIWHQHFSETAAYLYLSGLRMKYVDAMTMLTRDINERHPDTTPLDYSFIKELAPNDLGYFCQTIHLCSLPPLDKIREQIEQEYPQMAKPERELMILRAQNDELNRITGWSGLTMMMQKMYVENFWKAIGSTSNNEEKENIMRAILPQLTHLYLKNGIKEITNNRGDINQSTHDY